MIRSTSWGRSDRRRPDAHRANRLEAHGLARIGRGAHEQLGGIFAADARGERDHVKADGDGAASVGGGDGLGVTLQVGRGEGLEPLGRGLAHRLFRVLEPRDQASRAAFEAKTPDGVGGRGAHGPRRILERREHEPSGAARPRIPRRASREGAHLERRVVDERHDPVDQARATDLEELEVSIARDARVGRGELLDDLIEVADALEGQGRAAADLALRIAKGAHQGRGVLQPDALEGLERAKAGDVVGIGQSRDEHVDGAFGRDARHRPGGVSAHLRRRIAQRGLHQGLQRLAVLDLAQGRSDRDAEQIVARREQGHERLDRGGRADLTEDASRPHAPRP